MSDWERVQELFLMAVELSAEERVRVLDAACPQGSGVRAEVESLLASDGDSGTIISDAVQGEAVLLLDSGPLVGRRVGAYRIVREIGRGGMGAVYLATRDDAEFRKQVAIKVVKPGMDTAEVLDRFRYERQILANLEHPYIARLFDGGSTAEGRPFFVMEYIEGRPVNEYCRVNTLSNRARCELFLRILEAVSYAHRNLVVHRDIKPGNIFVTADGTPKLLDFGVAKVIGGIDGSRTMTALGRPFTPEYASPEQVLGAAVTTSTDIYSLGAVLYELLTDCRAQPIETLTPSEIERVVCSAEPRRPSQIAPSVDADLDNIVMMAMRKEPDRRYQSADQFADDIRRYLDKRPVLARQDSMVYRLRKFVVRNRLEIAMGSLVFLGLATALVISLRQTHRAREALIVAEVQRLTAMHERTRAESEAKSAEAARTAEAAQRAISEEQRDVAQRETAIAGERVSDLFELANRTLFDVHDSVAKLTGSIDTRKQIVKTTLEYLEHLREENGLDDRMRLALAGAYYKVAEIQGSYYFPSLQDFDGAQASLKTAARIIDPLYERDPSDTQVAMRYLDIHIEITNNMQEAGKPEAVKDYTDLLAIARRVAKAQPCGIDCEKQESEIENQLAEAYSRLDDPRTLDHANREVELTRELLARHPSDPVLQRDVAIALSSAANAQKSFGDLNKAAEDYLESIRIREGLMRSQPPDGETHRGLFVAYGNYATILGIPWSPNLGHPDEAREMAVKCVALARESAADPEDQTARFDLAMALGKQGMVDPAPGDVNESLAHLLEALPLMEAAVRSNSDSAFYATQLALLLEFQGHRLEMLGEEERAVESYRKSLEALRPFANSGNNGVEKQTLASEEALARAYANRGEIAAASALAAGALELAEKSQSQPPSEYQTAELARAHGALAEVQEKAGLTAKSHDNAVKALALWGGIRNPSVLSIRKSSQKETEELLTQLDKPGR
jgi:eukaryotic-like serine/threonine-protein kinase